MYILYLGTQTERPIRPTTKPTRPTSAPTNPSRPVTAPPYNTRPTSVTPTPAPTYPSRPATYPTSYPTGTHQGVQPPTQPPGNGQYQPGTNVPQQPGNGPYQPITNPPQHPATGFPSYPQFIIVPYPIPMAGVPGGCPCYYMQQNNTQAQSQGGQATQAVAQPAPTQQYPVPQSPPYPGNYGTAGFFAYPIIFYPACGANVQQQVQQMFTGAVPVPYSCDACAQAAQQQQQQQAQPQKRRTNRRRRIIAVNKDVNES